MRSSSDFGIGYSPSEIAQRLSYLRSRIEALKKEADAIFDIPKGGKPLNQRNEVEILEDEQSHHTRRMQLNTDLEEIQVQVENICNLFKAADMLNNPALRQECNNFCALVEHFQRIQTKAKDSSKAFLASARRVSLQPYINSTSEPPVQQLQTQQQLTQEVEFLNALSMEIAANEQLVRAREDGIRRVYTEICELNEMFEDIGELVSEQSGLLDNIEAAVEATTMRTRAARDHLVEADVRRSSRSWTFWIIVIVLAVVVLIAILFS